MPTTNPRINVTLEAELMNLLTELAAQEQKSVARLTKELVLEALERREDRTLSSIASERDTKNQKTVKHDDVWK